MSGTLFIVAAPSGAGKSSLVNALLAREPRMRLSISYTTRAPRPGESEGQHYRFVDLETFLRMAEDGAFLEYAEVHGNYYGTARAVIDALLEEDCDVALEIDYQGAQQIRALCGDCVSIFILPPSRTELERRLRARAQDSAATIERRLANSREEIAHAHEFDYLVVNDDFQRALDDLSAIVRSRRLRRSAQLGRHAGLLHTLLMD